MGYHKSLALNTANKQLVFQTKINQSLYLLVVKWTSKSEFWNVVSDAATYTETCYSWPTLLL